MSDPEKASLLLQRAGRVLSGNEVRILESVRDGEPLSQSINTVLAGEGDPSIVERRDQFIRLQTEFARYLS